MTQPESLSKDYLPLQVGNSWVYAVNAAGAERRETIEAAVRIDGNTYFRFSSYAGRAGSLLRLDAQNRMWERIDDRDVLLYDFGAQAGATWSYPGGTVVLVGREETVTVPAGTFRNCVQFHYTVAGKEGDWDEWLAPGVGPVKRHLFSYAIVEYELESYRTAPAK